jgi:hypothetical protein
MSKLMRYPMEREAMDGYILDAPDATIWDEKHKVLSLCVGVCVVGEFGGGDGVCVGAGVSVCGCRVGICGCGCVSGGGFHHHHHHHHSSL